MLEILNKLNHYSVEQPDMIALSFEEDVLTYQQHYTEIQQLKSVFMYLPKGSRVGLLSKSPLHNMLNYFAILEQGSIPCFLDDQWSEVTIHQLIETYHIDYLVDEQHRLIKTTSSETYPTYLNEQSQVHQLLHIGFTSGTTGLPKAYYRNEPSWLASYKENEKLLRHKENILVAPGPLAHSLSLYTCIYALYTGRTFIGQTRFNATKLVSKMKQQTTNSALFLVPTMLHAITKINHDHLHLTTILSSGAKLSSSLFKRIAETFQHANIIEFFGTSEASFISYNINRKASVDSVGYIFQNVTIGLEEKDKNHIGLLNVKSNMIFSGYVNQSVVLPETWIKTGDYAYIKDNQLYLVSRQNERLIIGGKNVYPQVIEQMIKNIDGVEEAIVIGEPHPRFGEIAVLLYTGSIELEYQTVRQHIMKVLSRYDVPSKLIKVDSMQYTQSGKVARNKMRTAYVKGDFK